MNPFTKHAIASATLLAIVALTSCTKEGDTILMPDPDDAPDTSPLVTVVYAPDALGS